MTVVLVDPVANLVLGQRAGVEEVQLCQLVQSLYQTRLPLVVELLGYGVAGIQGSAVSLSWTVDSKRDPSERVLEVLLLGGRHLPHPHHCP